MVSHRALKLGALSVLVGVSGAISCTGNIGQPPSQPNETNETNPPPGSTDPGNTPGDGSETACTTSPGFVPLHRLTKREYNAAISTVFGVTGDFSLNLPSDSKVARFDNNSAAQQINAALTEGYLTASGLVVEAIRANTEASARWLSCEGDDELACAQATIESVAQTAFRRDVTPAEVDALLDPYRRVRDLSLSYQDGMSAALRAVLVSPDFLFRTLGADGQAPAVPVEAIGEGTIVELNGEEFVTRLAAFIWGSVPDATLLAQARAGEFDRRHEPATQTRVLETIQRMLQDPQADAMVDVFFNAFLHLDMLSESDRQPDRMLYPEWNNALDAAVRTETRTFIAKIIEEDTSPMQLLTGNYSYLNRALAETIYGLPGDGFDETFQRTPLPAERRGIMTQPFIMAMTSNPDRTSIVNRGLWVMENIMCLPTPTDAPPGVPTEPPEIEGASLRERIEAHRTDPSCAVCHATIDPIGFGLENFDAIGRYRQIDDDGFPVDSRGELPDGRAFSSAVELVDMINRSGDFKTCLARNMLEYAVGRRMGGPGDQCTMDRIADTMTADAPFSTWVFQVAMSSPFSYQQRPVDAQ